MVTAQNRRSNLLPSRPTPVTTNRNNLNRPRIFSFRAKLQTPQSVSTPSCATVTSKQRTIQRKGNQKPHNFSGFQASEPAAPIATRVQQKGGNEVSDAGDELGLKQTRRQRFFPQP